MNPSHFIILLLQQLCKHSALSSLGEDDEEFLCHEQVENQRMNCEGEPLDIPSEESADEDDQNVADPEWKLLEEEAENDDGGNDKEGANPLTRNTVKYTCRIFPILCFVYL